jgi:hypothetical protein
LNTINVPYVTDRWVKIQSIVDLDEDWTRVYYDDELIAEYAWTGGVYGAGGGVPDIAAVDLFANGSSSVLYDDLLMEPITGACGENLDVDFDNDGLSLLEEILGGTSPCNPDSDLDGLVDGADICPLAFNPDQEDSDGDGIGDACDETPLPPCPPDFDGDGQVGISDLLSVLALWGSCPNCPQDLDGDGVVGVTDLLTVLATWGACT